MGRLVLERALVLALAVHGVAHADPGHYVGDGADWSFIAQAVGKSSSTVVGDGRWRPFLKQQLPAIKVDLGVFRRAVPLVDSVAELLGGPSDDTISTNGLVRLSACRRHSCMEKAVVLVDVPGHRATIALVHYKFGDESSDSEPMLLVASRTPAPAPEHLAAVDAWLAELGLKPGIRRYLRPSGEVVNLDGPAQEALDGMFGFDWLKPSKAKCVPFKALAIRDPATCWLGAGSSFLPVEGKWYRCVVSKAEFLLYPSQKVCQEQFETMQANGD
jgi:hypothetical protein